MPMKSVCARVCVCVHVNAQFKVFSLMSLQVRVKYSLLDAVLCVLECGSARALACLCNSVQTFN